MKKELKKDERETVKKIDSFRVLNLISKAENGITIDQLCKLCKCQPNAIYSHIRRLRQHDLIKRLAYGCWKIVPEKLSVDPKVSHLTLKSNPQILGHNFCFSMKLPRSISNWEKRRIFLENNRISYKELGLKGKIESFQFKGNTIWLTDNKICIYISKNFYASMASETRNMAIEDFKGLISDLEALFSVKLCNNEGYIIKLSNRSHYAKVADPLAMDYRRRKQKLSVRLSNSWLKIDFSHHIDHLELQGEQPDYMDNSIIPFFRSLEGKKGFTADFVLNAFGLSTQITNQFQEIHKDLLKHIIILEKHVFGNN